MCKVDMLRELLNQRLSAAVEEILVAFKGTIAEYEEELSRAKQENERQRQLLEDVFKKPREEFQGADVSKDLHQEWQEPELSHIKVEEEPKYPQVKEEDNNITNFQFTHVPVKCEEDGNKGSTVKNGEAKLPSGTSSRYIPTESDGDHCGGSTAGSLRAVLLGSEDSVSNSPDTDEEHSKGDMKCHADKKKLKCSQCGKTFAARHNLNQHMRTHTGEKPFACSLCALSFTDSSGFVEHTGTHSGEKPFVCSVCGKRFTQKGSLIKHTRTHTGDKPFTCSVCNISFGNRSSLRTHARIHTGEKPYVCSVCGKGFSVKGNLRSHTRTHTGEKPFTCSVCNISFRYRTGLIQHTRTHTGERPFCCLVCGQRFSQKQNLTSHTRIHTGERPFSCSVCDKKFYVKYHVKRHKCAGGKSSKT
ncbi:gastrula zinc finger protein XlCGF57.1-like isoform X1 [Syngnathoides biaculeatus]|uniref:gastrula zinc finger protein XlCGF57.1-like isoform X1 n=1 Tax=Syngnathoides biaculeatus TaxID=300417 RepID=UPI002ADDFCD4|nr:gastrula zinc finger protein XlCGF57.1-like isoform X1 [Syngnathoides biaculeatus]